jgi:hypothetical protein
LLACCFSLFQKVHDNPRYSSCEIYGINFQDIHWVFDNDCTIHFWLYIMKYAILIAIKLKVILIGHVQLQLNSYAYPLFILI